MIAAHMWYEHFTTLSTLTADINSFQVDLGNCLRLLVQIWKRCKAALWCQHQTIEISKANLIHDVCHLEIQLHVNE